MRSTLRVSILLLLGLLSIANGLNAFGCGIREDKFLIAAQEIVDKGLKESGYESRDKTTGRLVPDFEKFRDGIKGTADKIHAMGLKIGIYSDAGDETCAGYPREWGVDYLKYDNCGVPDIWADEYQYWPEFWYGTWENQTGGIEAPPGYDWSQSNTAKRYNFMRDALHDQSNTIFYSLCNWGHSHVERWGNDTGQSWRMWDDVVPQWAGQIQWSWVFMPILNYGIIFLEYSNFFGHNDLDMLEVGNGNLTSEETRTHIGLWAALKSPLFIGTPIDEISDEDLGVFRNWELLAFNQDNVWGAPAFPTSVNPDRTWNQTHPAKYYSGGSKHRIHVFVINTLDKTATKTVDFDEVPGLNPKEYILQERVQIQAQDPDTAALLFVEKDGKHPCSDPKKLPKPKIYSRKPKRWLSSRLLGKPNVLSLA
ncbi:glycoside hydrolase [Choiromyces venosus 120613-1]|uniref:Alpha-galactosidase n=1 Tax=Choiromyces venosus 120613-1 TaxID=1336337 RepID=A0A3N4JMU6_9PEZI|nr:glycoside hydrolase [Choiromyces venosus 120613-1]